MIKKPAITLILALFQLAAYAQQTYQLDVKKSKILWDNRKTMGGHYGYLLFNSGSLNYSSGSAPESGLFSMDMNSMRSTDHKTAVGNQKVDKELLTPGFFDVARHPAAMMNVKRIVRAGNPTTFNVFGDLTIKGITNAIEFPATIKQNGKTINVTAQLKIHRLLWNIDMQNNPKSWDPFSAIKSEVIPDDIAISLNLVFNKP